MQEEQLGEISKKQEKSKKKQAIEEVNNSSIKKMEFGESLGSCSDTEWDRADPAYGSELINVKKKPNKVTVFAGPRAKTIERTIIKTDSLSEELDENANAIGRMASAIAHIFLSNKSAPSVEVTIDMREIQNKYKTPSDQQRA